ncbi:hypothetical protein [unidentified bacterial endosymbiont]|uniref:hypothetical protein n=1 Tax=unidentified bacterial endosymbiont TaxID=2355 RepID=UPI0020A1980C|nr:hypothetical protein [unidentified bacterial endosymbiont]
MAIFLQLIFRDNLSPLSQAALDMNHDEMLALINIGVCVNKANRYGTTALMISSIKNDKKGVLILLNAGANSLLRNSGNQNALSMTNNDEIKKIIKKSSDELRKFRSNFEDHKIFSLPVTNMIPIVESDKNKTISASVLGIAGLSLTTELARYAIENISDQSEPYRIDVNQTRSVSLETDNYFYKNLWWISGITLPIMALVTKKLISYFRKRSDASTTNSYNNNPLLEDSSPSSSVDQFNEFIEYSKKDICSSINFQTLETNFELSSLTSPIESKTSLGLIQTLSISSIKKEEPIYDVPRVVYAVPNPIKKAPNNLTGPRISTLSTISAQGHEVEKFILELEKLQARRESTPFFDIQCIRDANITSGEINELQKLIACCASERESPAVSYRSEQTVNPVEAHLLLV